MIKRVFLLVFFIFSTNCSLDTKTGLWSESEDIKKENNPVIKEVFKDSEVLERNFNENIKINLKDEFKKNSFKNNLTNNNGYLNYYSNLDKITKYKFSKIDGFKFIQPDLLFNHDNSMVFFENKGSIIKFNENSKKIWKVNHYNKSEKKLNPTLFFASNNKFLVVADNISNYYLMDLISGELLWKKNNASPFNSQVKIHKDKFFVIDLTNTLRCFSLKNGKELWKFKSESPFINSQQKFSLIVKDKKIVFINSLGDVTAVNIENGNLLWQTPTQSNSIYENAFLLKNSDLVLEKNLIFFSNNKNQIFSLSLKNGSVLWKQNVNSNLRPTIIGRLLFTVSYEGYLTILDSTNGNIIRITNVFDRIKDYKKNKIEPVGFIVAKNKIYLSLNNGKLITINITSGKSIDVIKIDGNKISRPYVLNKSMYLLKDNAILKIN